MNITAASLIDHDATALASLVAAQNVSAEELVRAHLELISERDPTLNAFVTVAGERALAEARDPRPGPLSGVPFSVKDSIDTEGLLTTRGSRLYADHTPDRDATAVARLRAAGAIVIGKTNCPEMSYWTETDNLVIGRTRNPHDVDRTPGGSSGGESAAIAAGMSPLGLGSDVGISVRGPAHDTGIASIKPTHGRVPCTGLFPPVMLRFWHIGPMARSVRDLQLALRLIEGPDGVDPWSVTPRGAGDSNARRPTRVANLCEAFGPLDPDVAQVVSRAASVLAARGVRVDAPRTPWLEHNDGPTSKTLFTAEIAPFVRDIVARSGAQRVELFATTQAVLDSREPSIAEYVAAQWRIEELRRRFAELFATYDFALAPVCPMPAPKPGMSEYTVDGHTIPARDVLRATVPFNLTGLPAVSLPFGRSHSALPIGVQLIGPWWSDYGLLLLAAELEEMAEPAPRPRL